MFAAPVREHNSGKCSQGREECVSGHLGHRLRAILVTEVQALGMDFAHSRSRCVLSYILRAQLPNLAGGERITEDKKKSRERPCALHLGALLNEAQHGKFVDHMLIHLNTIPPK